MKRSASISVSPSPPPMSPVSQEATGMTPTPPATPHKKPRNNIKSPTSVPKLNANGTWTPEKKRQIMEHIIGEGIKAVNYADLAQKVGVSTTQLRNALQLGHKNNLRDRAIKSAAGMD